MMIERGAIVRPYTRLLCNIAARMDHPELMKVLLDGGADPGLAQTWGVLRPPLAERKSEREG